VPAARSAYGGSSLSQSYGEVQPPGYERLAAPGRYLDYIVLAVEG